MKIDHHNPLHVVLVVTHESPIQSDEIISSNHHQESSNKYSCIAISFSRVIAVAFLSLLLPLSFLLLARLSTARYYKSLADHDHTSILTLVFLKTETTLVLSLLVTLITISSFVNSLTKGRVPYVCFISERVRLHGAWILLFMMQVCLSLGIHGTIDAEVDGLTVSGLLVVDRTRRVCLLLGLHECMVFWWKSVVKPVVDETFYASNELEWVEKGVMAVALGNLWLRRLRDEAEALVVLPWVKEEIGLEDVVGLCLYCLMVVIGVVKVVRGGAWVLTRSKG